MLCELGQFEEAWKLETCVQVIGVMMHDQNAFRARKIKEISPCTIDIKERFNENSHKVVLINHRSIALRYQPSLRQTTAMRSVLKRILRDYLHDCGIMEVDLPILSTLRTSADLVKHNKVFVAAPRQHFLEYTVPKCNPSVYHIGPCLRKKYECTLVEVVLGFVKFDELMRVVKRFFNVVCQRLFIDETSRALLEEMNPTLKTHDLIIMTYAEATRLLGEDCFTKQKQLKLLQLNDNKVSVCVS